MAQRLENLETALANAHKGIVSIPCRPGTKIPLVKWKRWQTEMPSETLLREWFSTRCNIAIVTTGMLVFDVDDPAEADLVIQNCGDTPHKVRTPRGGIHLGYRRRGGVEIGNEVKINGHAIDIRTDGGLEMIPNSETEHGCYEWLGPGLLPKAELPVAKIGWTRERQRRKVVEAVESFVDMDFMEYRARRWLEKVPGAISGQRGHDATFRVACKLTHYFRLDRERAIRLMLTAFNPRCEPPWQLTEIEHKVDDALKKRA